MRIGGIASGLDTESIVRDLMRAERGRVNRFLRQEETIKWRREAFQNMNRSMANFVLNSRRELGLTQISHNGTIRSTAVNSLTWVKNASSSNEQRLITSARADAANGIHEVEILNLAKVARVNSNRILGNSDEESNLLNSNLTFKEGGSFEITSNVGTDIINISKDETIGSLVNKINSASVNGRSLGLTAAFDRNVGRLMISSRETGDEKTIAIQRNDFTEALFSGDVLDTGVRGENAKINFNGNEVERNSNLFTIFGIEMNLRSVTSTGEKITINVSTNVDGIVDKIRGFVNSYNSLIEEIQGRLSERTHRDFFPLVKEEREAMSEREIEQWEEKARSGLLRGDSNLTRTLQTIRTDLFRNVEGISGSFNHITQLGISTGFFRDGGKLVIDETRLRDAIVSDPDGVIEMFFKAPSQSAEGVNRTAESGIIQRVFDGFVTGMREIIRQSGPGDDDSLLRGVQGNMMIDFVTRQGSISILDRELSRINTRISREEELLFSRENAYWKRFSAMEKAMSKMQQQGMWLMAKLGMGQ